MSAENQVNGPVVRPASELVPVYEARLAQAEANFNWWRDEFDKHGDLVSEIAWRYAEDVVHIMHDNLDNLRKAGGFVLMRNAADQSRLADRENQMKP